MACFLGFFFLVSFAWKSVQAAESMWECVSPTPPPPQEAYHIVIFYMNHRRMEAAWAAAECFQHEQPQHLKKEAGVGGRVPGEKMGGMCSPSGRCHISLLELQATFQDPWHLALLSLSITAPINRQRGVCPTGLYAIEDPGPRITCLLPEALNSHTKEKMVWANVRGWHPAGQVRASFILDLCCLCGVSLERRKWTCLPSTVSGQSSCRGGHVCGYNLMISVYCDTGTLSTTRWVFL